MTNALYVVLPYWRRTPPWTPYMDRYIGTVVESLQKQHNTYICCEGYDSTNWYYPPQSLCPIEDYVYNPVTEKRSLKEVVRMPVGLYEWYSLLLTKYKFN